MKKLKQVLSVQSKKILFAAALATVAGSASAALPAGVSDAVTAIGTDAATLGGLVLVVVVGIAAFKFLRRAL